MLIESNGGFRADWVTQNRLEFDSIRLNFGYGVVLNMKHEIWSVGFRLGDIYLDCWGSAQMFNSWYHVRKLWLISRVDMKCYQNWMAIEHDGLLWAKTTYKIICMNALHAWFWWQINPCDGDWFGGGWVRWWTLFVGWELTLDLGSEMSWTEG